MRACQNTHAQLPTPTTSFGEVWHCHLLPLTLWISLRMTSVILQFIIRNIYRLYRCICSHSWHKAPKTFEISWIRGTKLSFVYVNGVTSGKHLKIGVDCQWNQAPDRSISNSSSKLKSYNGPGSCCKDIPSLRLWFLWACTERYNPAQNKTKKAFHLYV